VVIAVGLGSLVVASAAVGDISRFAGNYSAGFSGDGSAASSAQLNGPTGVDVDAFGNVYIADRENNRIRIVDSGGTIDTLVSGLLKPVDVAVDQAANVLYFTEEVDPFVNRVSMIDLDSPGAPVVIAGGASSGFSGDGGVASAATFRGITGIAVAPDGNVYIADRGNNVIRRIDMSASPPTIERIAGSSTGAAGGDNGDALTEATFAGPKDVAVASDGTVYVADELTNTIRKLSGGVVSVFAGNYSAGFSGDDGPATSASVHAPSGIAVDTLGNVYIGDTTNNRVRKVDISTLEITTVAGNGTCCASGDGGPATSAAIGNPVGLAAAASGALWIAARADNAVRFVEGAAVPLNPPSLAKRFGAQSMPRRATTTLTFTLSNPNAGSSLSGMIFTDPLPLGLRIGTPNGLINTCGGIAQAVAGSGALSLSGVSLPASGTCTLQVNVRATSSTGIKNNQTAPITSNEAGLGNRATATITVTP